MDYKWIACAAIVLISAVVVSIAASYLFKVLTHRDEYYKRTMGASRTSVRKCDMLSPSQWDAAITLIDKMTPDAALVKVFAFADYVDAKQVECEYPEAIDYGIALGFDHEGKGRVDYQVSLVFKTEDITGIPLSQMQDDAQSRRNTINLIQATFRRLGLREGKYASIPLEVPFVAYGAQPYIYTPAQEQG